MFLHSFQALIYNLIARKSLRIAGCGKLDEGDCGT
jgi:hypothetical protein